MRKQGYNERFFDEYYKKKTVIDYYFDEEIMKKMTWKDRRIIECLRNYGVSGKRCLDVGPGTGRWLKFLHQSGASYIGAIDVSQKSLDRCRQTCPEVDELRKADIENERFDFENDSFDIIISISVIEHIRNPENYLQEIRRVIKDKGFILMATDNVVSLISRLRLLVGILPITIGSDPTHVRFFRRRDIDKLFRKYDMKPVFVPASISLNPISSKSKLCVRSNHLLSVLDDDILWYVNVRK